MPRCIRVTDAPNVVREFRAAAMLTGFSQVKNAAFNIASSLFRVPITAAAVGVEAGTRAVGAVVGQPVPQQLYAGEVTAHLYGFFHALPLLLRSFGRQTKSTRDVLIGSSLEDIAGRSGAQTLETQGLRAAGAVVSLPFKGLSWVDDFSFNFNYSAQMSRFAYRRARAEGYKGAAAWTRVDGILNEQAREADALSQRVAAEVFNKLSKAGPVPQQQLQAEIGKALRAATPDELADPRTLVERTIFINKEGRGLDQMLDLLEEIDKGTGRAVSLFAPFRRTPANEAREFLRSSPVGGVTAFVKYKQALAAGADPNSALRHAYEDVGQAIVGTASLASIVLALRGGMFKVTPFYTGKSKALRTTEEAAGQSQESVTIGNYNVPVRNLGTLGQAILSTEKAVREFDIWREANPQGTSPPERILFWSRQASLGLVLGVADQQFLQNLTELHEAWKNPETSLPVFAQRFGASFVPSIAKAVVRAGQPVVPVPEEEAKQGFLRNVVAGARQAVVPEGPEKLGLFGEFVTRAPGVAGALMSSRTLTEDPLIRKMLEVNAVHVAPATDIQLQIRGKKVKFTDVYGPDDQVVLGQAKGALQRAYMQSQLRASGFDRLPPEKQKLLLDAAFMRAGRAVDGRMRQFAQYRKRPNYRDLLRGLLPTVR